MSGGSGKRGRRVRAWVAALLAVPAVALAEEAPEPLSVGISDSYPPLAFAKDGALAGVEVDLARLVGQELGVEVAFVPMPFPDLVPAVAAGKVDVAMSGLSVTEERSASVRFADPYLRVGQMALIRADDLGRTADGIDAEGTRVGVKTGTTGEGWARANLSKSEVVSFETIEDGTKALREEEIDYFVHDAPTVWRLTGRFETRDDSLAGIYRPLTEEYLAWAVRADDEDLAERLNAALATLRKDGRLKEVLTRWIPVTKVAVSGDAPRPTAAPATAP